MSGKIGGNRSLRSDQMWRVKESVVPEGTQPTLSTRTQGGGKGHRQHT